MQSELVDSVRAERLRVSVFHTLVRDSRPLATREEITSLFAACDEARDSSEWLSVWRAWDTMYENVHAEQDPDFDVWCASSVPGATGAKEGPVLLTEEAFQAACGCVGSEDLSRILALAYAGRSAMLEARGRSRAWTTAAESLFFALDPSGTGEVGEEGASFLVLSLLGGWGFCASPGEPDDALSSAMELTHHARAFITKVLRRRVGDPGFPEASFTLFRFYDYLEGNAVTTASLERAVARLRDFVPRARHLLSELNLPYMATVGAVAAGGATDYVDSRMRGGDPFSSVGGGGDSPGRPSFVTRLAVREAAVPGVLSSCVSAAEKTVLASLGSGVSDDSRTDDVRSHVTRAARHVLLTLPLHAHSLADWAHRPLVLALELLRSYASGGRNASSSFIDSNNSNFGSNGCFDPTTGSDALLSAFSSVGGAGRSEPGYLVAGTREEDVLSDPVFSLCREAVGRYVEAMGSLAAGHAARVTVVFPGAVPAEGDVSLICGTGKRVTGSGSRSVTESGGHSVTGSRGVNVTGSRGHHNHYDTGGSTTIEFGGGADSTPDALRNSDAWAFANGLGGVAGSGKKKNKKNGSRAPGNGGSDPLVSRGDAIRRDEWRGEMTVHQPIVGHRRGFPNTNTSTNTDSESESEDVSDIDIKSKGERGQGAVDHHQEKQQRRHERRQRERDERKRERETLASVAMSMSLTDATRAASLDNDPAPEEWIDVPASVFASRAPLEIPVSTRGQSSFASAQSVGHTPHTRDVSYGDMPGPSHAPIGRPGAKSSPSVHAAHGWNTTRPISSSDTVDGSVRGKGNEGVDAGTPRGVRGDRNNDQQMLDDVILRMERTVDRVVRSRADQGAGTGR